MEAKDAIEKVSETDNNSYKRYIANTLFSCNVDTSPAAKVLS